MEKCLQVTFRRIKERGSQATWVEQASIRANSVSFDNQM